MTDKEIKYGPSTEDKLVEEYNKYSEVIIELWQQWKRKLAGSRHKKEKSCETCRHRKYPEEYYCETCVRYHINKDNWAPKKIIQKELEGFIGYDSDDKWYVYYNYEEWMSSVWGNISKCKVIFLMEE